MRDKLVYNADSFIERLEKVETRIADLDIIEVQSIRAEIKTAKDKIKSIIDALPEGNHFFGWGKVEFKNTFTDFRKAFNKLIGLFISAFLISFGAPFWHDYLKTFVSIRKSVAGNTRQDAANKNHHDKAKNEVESNLITSSDVKTTSADT